MPELTPEQRTKLDTNIKMMLSKGATPDDVKKYASDFNAQFSVKKKEPSDVPSLVGSIGGQSLSEVQSQSQRSKLTDYVKSISKPATKELSTEAKQRTIAATQWVKPFDAKHPYSEDKLNHDAAQKVADVFMSNDDKYKDPFKYLNSDMSVSSERDLLVNDRARNILAGELMPTGYDAQRILNTTHLGGEPETNVTKQYLQNAATKYNTEVQELKNLPKELGQANANSDWYDYNTTPAIESAAIKWRMRNDKEFATDIQKRGVNPNDPLTLDSYKLGETLNAYLQNPDVKTYFNQENPSMLNAAQRASQTLLTKNTDYGKNVVAQEVSQAVQKSGYNSIDPIVNYYGQNHKEYADLVAKDLYRDNPEKLAIWNKYIKDNQEEYMDAPSFFQRFAKSGGDVLKGVPNTLLTYLKGSHMTDVTAQDIQDKWDKQAKNVSADPQGLSKFFSDFGDVAGLVSGVAAVGNVTGISNPTNAGIAATGLAFFGNEIEAGKEKYPNNPLLAFLSGAGNTAMYMALSSDLFPAEKAKSAFQTVKPEVGKVMEQLSSGEISREAARKEMNTIAQKAFDFAGGTIKKSAKTAAEMGGIAMVNRMMDGIFMDNENFQKYHPDDELVKTLGHTFLTFLPVSGLAKLGEMRSANTIARESYYALAQRPKYFASVISELAAKDPSINKEELYSNLQFVVSLKNDLDAQKVPEAKQKKLIYNELLKKVAIEQAPKTPESTLLRFHDEKIRGLDKDNERILNEPDEKLSSESKQGITEVQPDEKNISQKSDNDIEKRMQEIEGNPNYKDEFNLLEKEMEKRERGSVFNVPLDKVNEAIDALMQKEKYMPNGFGAFIEKRDARETKEVANSYLNSNNISNEKLISDFKEAILGNPDTWYADGLKLRESMRVASERGIEIEKLLQNVEDEFIKDGYSSQEAKDIIGRRIASVYKGSENSVVENPAQPQLQASEPIPEPDNGKTNTEGEQQQPEVATTPEPPASEPPTPETPLEGDNGANTVGVSHASLTKLADKLGLKAPKTGEVLLPAEYAERGRKLLEAGADPNVVDDPKSGDLDDRISVARAHLEDLVKQADAIGREKGVDSEEYKNAAQQIEDYTNNKVKPLGTKAGEAMRALQGERDLDTGSFTEVKNAIEKDTGKPITEKQSAKIEELTKQNEELKKRAEEAEKKLIEETEKNIGKEKEEPQTFKEKAKKAADKFRKLKTKPMTFKDENGNEHAVKMSGVGWNELVELGAKAIEATGEIADGVKAVLDKIAESDFYKSLSQNDKDRFAKQLESNFIDSLSNTPEAKNIRRLEKELDNLRSGIVKQQKTERELSEKEKELQEQIFEAKKNLGLIPSKGVEEQKVIKTEEEKKIERLEKQLEDLQNGVVKDKKEKTEDSQEVKDLKEKIFEAKKNLGLIASRSMPKNPSEKLTPEERSIKAKEKQLEDLRQGIVKQANEKRELSNREKELNDQIFEEKKKLGLVKSKVIDDTDYGLKITETEKKIKRLEKEKEGLENGVIKQKETNDEKPSPAQQEKIDQLKDDIFNLKKYLGLFKSKEGKPLTEEEQKALDQDELEKLQARFVDKKDNKFSMQDSKDIWDYAKKTYLDNGVPWREMIGKVRDDLGLTWMQVNAAITTPKTERISDEMWKKQSDYSKHRNATKNWVNNQSKGGVLYAIKKVSDKVRGVAVFGHGGIFLGTHAGMTFFSPSTVGKTAKAFINGWKFAYGRNGAKYERSMQELKSMKNYLLAQRAGLKNDPDRVNTEEFQKSQSFLGKLGGAGEKGFNAIKILRQELFDYHYERLSEEEKADKGAVENIAKLINNATGATNLPIPEFINEVSFAGGMEASRWGKLTRNPAKATMIAIRALTHPKEVPIADRVFAKVWARRVGEQLATYTSILAANAALQSLTGSKNQVNMTDPTKRDFLKMKVGDVNIDMTSGMLSALNFLTSLVQTARASQKELHGESRLKTLGGQLVSYGRGKASPFYSSVIDMFAQSDYAGNPMPFSNDKPTAGHHKLTWGEYLWNKAPIPVAEAARIAYESAHENGMDNVQWNHVLKGFLYGLGTGSTGFKVNENKEKPTPYNEEDAKDPTFKYFMDKGLELPNTSHDSELITDKKTLERKKLSEYPKEVQDNYDNIHKQELKDELNDVLKRGYVFIKKYSNGDFDVSQSRTPYSKRVDLKDLNNDELARVLSSAQSQATMSTKKKLFK